MTSQDSSAGTGGGAPARSRVRSARANNVIRLSGARSQLPLPSPASGSTGTAADQLELVPFSHDALAAEFGERYQHDSRYVDIWGKWMIYDGKVWESDVTRMTNSRARAICREIASAANDPNERKPLSSRGTVSAVEAMARSDRRLVAIVEQWDADLWGLNTEGGLIDLRTGELQPHQPDHWCTRIAAVAPDPTCSISEWLRFLDRVAPDPDLQGFLRRMAGYCLTGDTSAHALFFLYGVGANGKSTFVNVLTGIMHTYQRTAPMDTFVVTSSDRHPTDMAGLRGARLVTATETQEGRRWDEAKVKVLTGGDIVTARFMRQDFFDYVPQFKLVISGNHKPSLRSVDIAMRRRFHLVPFVVTVPARDRDPDLGDKLKTEWPGILHWAVQGCLEWQRIGLAPPPIVQDATDEYLQEEDSTQAWIDESGKRDANAFESAADLWNSWASWTQRSGEYTGNRKQFAQALERCGLRAAKSGSDSQRGYRGLRLNRY